MKSSPFALGFTALLLLTACGTSTPAADTPVPTAGTSSSAEAVFASSSADAVGSVASVPTARVIRIEATNWAFAPSAITAKKGEKVQLAFIGVAGEHGIGIPDLGVDVAIPEGQTVTVDLPTDKTGTFRFFCNVPCGEGHREMTGTITISD